MDDFLTIVGAVLPVFALAATGLWLRRIRWLTAEADASLLRLTVNVFFPCLVFDRLLGNEAFSDTGNLVLPPLVGFVAVAVGVLVARAVVPIARLAGAPERNTFVFSTAMFNYGYMAIPLVASLWRAQPDRARQITAVLLVHNVGVEIAMWTFGLVLLGGAPLRDAWRRILNVPVVAILITLLLNFVVGRQRMPVPILTVAHLLAECAIPLGILLVGATMADQAREFAGRAGLRVMALSCVARLGLLPVAFLVAAWLLPLPLELRQVIVVQAAMPAAVFPIVMAKHYGGHPTTALRVVVATSLVGLLTAPLWLRLGLAALRAAGVVDGAP